MLRTSNRNCGHLVENRILFKANNIFSELHGENYFVFSYGRHWILFAFVDGIWYENKDKYSQSTSKHRSQARPAGVNTILVSKEAIHKLY